MDAIFAARFGQAASHTSTGPMARGGGDPHPEGIDDQPGLMISGRVCVRLVPGFRTRVHMMRSGNARSDSFWGAPFAIKRTGDESLIGNHRPQPMGESRVRKNPSKQNQMDENPESTGFPEASRPPDAQRPNAGS